MILQFTEKALEDLEHWKKHDSAKVAKIKTLLANVLETPFAGLGKPEPLMFDLRGCWSRRIDREHRLVYKVSGNAVTVISCRFHYGK